METYTLEQVQQHTKKDDLWLVLFNKVYNITKYLEDHPGGEAILIEVAGTDATQAFEDIGHSEEAKELLGPFQIGVLPADEHAEEIESYRPTFVKVSQVAAIVPRKKSKSKSSYGPILKSLGTLGVAGALGALAYHNGWKSISQFLYSFRLNRLSSTGTGSSSFWTAFAAASGVYGVLTVGITTWIASKLDVQEEFTHHAPHRLRRVDRLILKKGGKTARAAVLDAQKYRKFKLIRKDLVSPNVYRFTFGLPNPDDVLVLPTGQHIALRADIQGKSVSRSYTPVSNNADLGRIELLVKVYPMGLMTKHLEGMEVGDEIEIRGPKGSMKYSKTYAKNIGMIAGGTGITPMYQLIRMICSDKTDNTKVSLLYANNTEEDILLRKELDDFARQNPEKFEVNYALAQANETWTGYKGFISADLIQKHLAPASPDSKVLLCGPPPMINAMKKNLAGMGWKTSGHMSKPDDQVFLF